MSSVAHANDDLNKSISTLNQWIDSQSWSTFSLNIEDPRDGLRRALANYRNSSDLEHYVKGLAPRKSRDLASLPQQETESDNLQPYTIHTFAIGLEAGKALMKERKNYSKFLEKFETNTAPSATGFISQNQFILKQAQGLKEAIERAIEFEKNPDRENELNLLNERTANLITLLGNSKESFYNQGKNGKDERWRKSFVSSARLFFNQVLYHIESSQESFRQTLTSQQSFLQKDRERAFKKLNRSLKLFLSYEPDFIEKAKKYEPLYQKLKDHLITMKLVAPDPQTLLKTMGPRKSKNRQLSSSIVSGRPHTQGKKHDIHTDTTDTGSTSSSESGYGSGSDSD